MSELKKYTTIELDLLGLTEASSGDRLKIREKVLQVIELFEDCSDEKDLARNCVIGNLISRALAKLPMSPLMLIPQEFNEEIVEDPIDKWPEDLPFQENSRCPSVRKDANGIYDIHGFVGQANCEYDCSTGSIGILPNPVFVQRPIIFETESGIRTGRLFKKAYIKPDSLKDGYNVGNPVVVLITLIKIDENRYEYEAAVEDLEELERTHNIEWHSMSGADDAI